MGQLHDFARAVHCEGSPFAHAVSAVDDGQSQYEPLLPQQKLLDDVLLLLQLWT
jgi:hypothetical protein